MWCRAEWCGIVFCFGVIHFNLIWWAVTFNAFIHAGHEPLIFPKWQTWNLECIQPIYSADMAKYKSPKTTDYNYKMNIHNLWLDRLTPYNEQNKWVNKVRYDVWAMKKRGEKIVIWWYPFALLHCKSKRKTKQKSAMYAMYGIVFQLSLTSHIFHNSGIP